MAPRYAVSPPAAQPSPSGKVPAARSLIAPPLRIAGYPTAAPYAPLKHPSPPLSLPSYSSSGPLDVLTVTDPTLLAAAATAPNRMGRVEGRGGADEGAGTKSRNERQGEREIERDRDRVRERERERVGERESEREREAETATVRKGVEGLRGVDALEEGRWGVRERCRSSEDWTRGTRGRGGGTGGKRGGWVDGERVGYG